MTLEVGDVPERRPVPPNDDDVEVDVQASIPNVVE